jgi:hypothetical protein
VSNELKSTWRKSGNVIAIGTAVVTALAYWNYTPAAIAISILVAYYSASRPLEAEIYELKKRIEELEIEISGGGLSSGLKKRIQWLEDK